MSHTKGTWKFNLNKTALLCFDSKNEFVTIYNASPYDSLEPRSGDANLIAAAPDLLEALQIAVRLIAVAENNGAYKDCALPLIGKKSLEKMESLLERLK
jgi:hypothetical protein